MPHGSWRACGVLFPHSDLLARLRVSETQTDGCRRAAARPTLRRDKRWITASWPRSNVQALDRIYKISTGLTRHPVNHEKSCEILSLTNLPNQALHHGHEFFDFDRLRDVRVVTRRERA